VVRGGGWVVVGKWLVDSEGEDLVEAFLEVGAFGRVGAEGDGLLVGFGGGFELVGAAEEVGAGGVIGIEVVGLIVEADQYT
jgi:hypothetical protein